jgi:hypothetical protein
MLLIGALFGANHFWKARSDALGFTPDKVSAHLPSAAEWEVPSNACVLPILSQKFTYLAEGKQAYAFQSEDGKYVLKLFQMRRFTPSWTDYLCPHLFKRRLKNRRWVFNGHKIAYTQFPQDTGVVFLHLNPTDTLNRVLTVVDQQGNTHQIDSDTTPFVLQEKAELIFDRLEKLAPQEREKAIQAVLDLVGRRVKKGYADRDKAVRNNYGFVGDRPIHLDVGRLHLGTRPGQQDHVQRRINRWQEESTKEATSSKNQ